MTVFKIALLQINPTKSIENNITKGIDACNTAKKQGADLALFPEIWQIGYNSKLMTLENAVTHDSEYIKTFQNLAQDLKIAIAITYLGLGTNKPTNNIAIIDNTGQIILDYAKIHVCDFTDGTEVSLESGAKFKVATLKFNSSSVKIGTMICFDREFNEARR